MGKIRGITQADFEWSTSEQVYPFEKDSSGNTLYCKEIAFGALPNNGAKTIAHNVTSIDTTMHRMDFIQYNASSSYFTGADLAGGAPYGPYINSTIVGVTTTGDFSALTGVVRLIYGKTA